MTQAAPFSFLVSPDSYLLRSYIASLVPLEPLKNAPEVHIFWGDEGLTDAFWDHLALQGLFASPKMLVLRNAQAIPAASLKQLSEALARAPSSVTTIICLEVAFERGKPKIPAHILKLPCYMHAQKKGWLHTLAALTPSSMPKFLQAEAARRQVRLSPSMLGRLVKILPSDAARAASEMEKLALAADADGRIPDEAIALVEESGESSIFDLLRSLQTNNNVPAAWNTLRDDRGESLIFSFLAVLAREARALWQILAGEEPSLPPQAIAAKKVIAQSLGFSGVAKLWDVALEADRGIKTGEKSPEQAFELLAAELFLLFQRPPARQQ